MRPSTVRRTRLPRVRARASCSSGESGRPGVWPSPSSSACRRRSEAAGAACSPAVWAGAEAVASAGAEEGSGRAGEGGCCPVADSPTGGGGGVALLGEGGAVGAVPGSSPGAGPAGAVPGKPGSGIASLPGTGACWPVACCPSVGGSGGVGAGSGATSGGLKACCSMGAWSGWLGSAGFRSASRSKSSGMFGPLLSDPSTKGFSGEKPGVPGLISYEEAISGAGPPPADKEGSGVADGGAAPPISAKGSRVSVWKGEGGGTDSAGGGSAGIPGCGSGASMVFASSSAKRTESWYSPIWIRSPLESGIGFPFGTGSEAWLR